ncbi:Mur ligase family protein [Blastochloris viridis]|uniref:UDP-N-acetylmuramoyl-tripeptide--D-alanyl-D-alanine ligase n=1 Tax=Blastochloris viridis TaxID=1079 RepID=A0A0H5BC67_BLAVI|nr:UDP-N-acetylmuramoyl-tripeptide--D-alanyl-D-alanine ligase [Blastochloris viridis]ALK08022.1 UDP-N-acetylmuramoyl-tripeptide--D-alanyl-D-alanine ligase [Blastochloris viridis]BAR98719.1 UDP-N-acetylmuramoylalanyl-D-glutamyl-2,6-diaminopimelate--D-alanyl-D-alanine ligase [Blastochloris viridis]CUU43944.1 UDP-N-acetylmuramoyl-tripeptide--D-alanyl-D-alanine ligase [Blastochloris viridis]
MVVLTVIAQFVLAGGFAFFAWRRALTYLHVFQQEEYDGARFLGWLLRTFTVDIRATVAMAVLGIAFYAPEDELVAAIGAVLGAVTFVVLGLRESDPRRVAKKTLAITERARRILIAAGAVQAAVVLAIVAAGLPLLAWIAAVQAIPFALIAGNLMLKPFEARVQRRFWTEAHHKLQTLKPTTVGITGSFGKTSVKHILGHLLSMQAPTLVTPGSINTPMGIARIVREQLAPHHRFFVCEMGAYGPGSVERLCRLAPPDLAIVTAIGPAHYERFKSLDTVARAKFELPAAARARGGIAVLAGQVLGFDAAKAFLAGGTDKVIVVGPETEARLKVLATRESRQGVEADVVWEGKSYALKAPLHGLHHAGNMALAFAAACALGADPDDLVTALKSTPQIAHRLEVKPQPDGSIVVDDAYNSNPVGFAAALASLDLIVGKTGRRILVTPGMVELGTMHDEEHARLGGVAADHVDVLLPVIPDRIDSFIDAFRRAAPDRPVVPCETFADAMGWLKANLRAGDVVLFENDLPDLYERRIRL